MITVLKPALIISLSLAALMSAPMAFSGGKHNEGMNSGQMMEGMPGSKSGQMINMDVMNNRMHAMTQMVNEAHNTKDMNKRHEFMQKHMEQMQNMMGAMNSMKSENMPGNMSMEQLQRKMGDRMDMMQGMMEQMMDQQSMMLDMDMAK